MTEKEDTLGETAEKLWQLVKSWFTRSESQWNKRQYPSSQINSQRATIDLNEFDEPILPAKKSKRGNVSINGRSYNGDVIGINNGRVMVNGVEVTKDFADSKTIIIDISGDVTMLAVDACDYVKIEGSAGKVETMSGSVTCGDVLGDVKTMSGSVTCGNIAGDVETMSGNVRRR